MIDTDDPGRAAVVQHPQFGPEDSCRARGRYPFGINPVLLHVVQQSESERVAPPLVTARGANRARRTAYPDVTSPSTRWGIHPHRPSAFAHQAQPLSGSSRMTSTTSPRVAASSVVS